MKTRAVDMLLAKHRIISGAASLALASFLAAGVVIALNAGFGGGKDVLFFNIEEIAGFLIGLTMALSLFSMAASTFYVIRHRRSLNDWGAFLAITWAIPYVGICVQLGGSNLLGRLKRSNS